MSPQLAGSEKIRREALRELECAVLNLRLAAGYTMAEALKGLETPLDDLRFSITTEAQLHGAAFSLALPLSLLQVDLRRLRAPSVGFRDQVPLEKVDRLKVSFFELLCSTGALAWGYFLGKCLVWVIS